MAGMASSIFTRNLPRIKFSGNNWLDNHLTSFFPIMNSKRPSIMFQSQMQMENPNRFKDPSFYNYTNGRIYKRLDSCLVVPPPKGKKPKAVIKFLGGAFVGAVPEVSYGYLLEQLAKEGYFIISVPYNVTFDHERVTKEIFERFHVCFDLILGSGFPDFGISAIDLFDLPLYSVGHSNGALLQVLAGSYFCEKIPKASAIISYNNRPASEAVPYFELLGPFVSQMIPFMEASPIYSFAQSTSDAWKMLLDTAGTIIPNYDAEVAVSVNKFVDQLPAVFNQLAQGISEFKPTPSENLNCFKNSYNVQNTLLVKFNNDAFDETDLLEETLKPRVEYIGGKLQKVVLNGTHITPCIQEPTWQVGDVYTPVDAVSQGLKAISLHDTRVLSKKIADWFGRLEA